MHGEVMVAVRRAEKVHHSVRAELAKRENVLQMTAAVHLTSEGVLSEAMMMLDQCAITAMNSFQRTSACAQSGLSKALHAYHKFSQQVLSSQRERSLAVDDKLARTQRMLSTDQKLIQQMRAAVESGGNGKIDGESMVAPQERMAKLQEIRHAALQEQAAIRKRQRELEDIMRQQLLPALKLWGHDEEREWHERYLAASKAASEPVP
jgi:hypothetical protein